MEDRASLKSVLEDVGRLVTKGWKLVLCHGGGPQANALQQRLGIPTNKVGGRRITDEDTLYVMKCVLAGAVAVDVVAACAAAGVDAVAISGVSGALVTARRCGPRRVSGGGDELVDFGLVGEVLEIRTGVIEALWQGGYVPVVNSLGIARELESDGARAMVFNINADTVASELAAALGVEHLFLMTSVPGVLRDKDDPSTRIPKLTAREARAAIAQGVIVGGMIPKVEEALTNIAKGIAKIHVLGAGPGVLEIEAEQPGTCGTVLIRD